MFPSIPSNCFALKKKNILELIASEFKKEQSKGSGDGSDTFVPAVIPNHSLQVNVRDDFVFFSW